MNKEEYKKYISAMIKKIDDIESLNRILNYVQKHFVKKAGK